MSPMVQQVDLCLHRHLPLRLLLCLLPHSIAALHQTSNHLLKHQGSESDAMMRIQMPHKIVSSLTATYVSLTYYLRDQNEHESLHTRTAASSYESTGLPS